MTNYFLETTETTLNRLKSINGQANNENFSNEKYTKNDYNFVFSLHASPSLKFPFKTLEEARQHRDYNIQRLAAKFPETHHHINIAKVNNKNLVTKTYKF